MSGTYPSQSRLRRGFVWIIVVLAVAVGGYSVVRYLIDRSNYTKGHQAYREAECAAAIDYFDRVINGWRLFDMGGYPALAQKDKKECLPFQAAVDKEESGDFSAALVSYADFVRHYSGSVLVDAARNRSVSLFELSEPSALASQESCERMGTLLEKDFVPQRDVNLPPFYLACGQVYDTANDQGRSFAMYKMLLTDYPDHSLAVEAEASLLANPLACEESNTLQKNSNIANRADFMPNLYFGCGLAYEILGEHTSSFDMHRAFLTEYPEHHLAAEVEAALLENMTSCERYMALKNTVIAERTDFIPSLYYHCGQKYEDDKDWKNAITMYENFLADYPGHSLASDVESALARLIVAQAKATNAGEIPAPERSGSTDSDVTEVQIQNDSPERLRIVFSGPESGVEELDACSSCKTYTGIGPLFCPEEGPIGRYTLMPGQYDVVVEAISDSGTTPWTGNWNLVSGDEYYSCFFITTTFLPW